MLVVLTQQNPFKQLLLQGFVASVTNICDPVEAIVWSEDA